MRPRDDWAEIRRVLALSELTNICLSLALGLHKDGAGHR